MGSLHRLDRLQAVADLAMEGADEDWGCADIGTGMHVVVMMASHFGGLPVMGPLERSGGRVNAGCTKVTVDCEAVRVFAALPVVQEET